MTDEEAIRDRYEASYPESLIQSIVAKAAELGPQTGWEVLDDFAMEQFVGDPAIQLEWSEEAKR